MRVVIETNIWISALLDERSNSARLFHKDIRRKFTLLYSDVQLNEFRRVSRYIKLKGRLRATQAGGLVNLARRIGLHVDPLPPVDISPDPSDNFLLAMAQAGDADFLLSGDKRDILRLGRHGNTKIVTARAFLEALA